MEIKEEEPRLQKITFSNICSVPDWMPEDKKEFRKNTNILFEKIISCVSLFKDKEVAISYFQEGVGSVVAKVTLPDSKAYVIKTTETPNRTVAEIKAYKAMSENGIKVPEVYTEGIVDEHPFLVMEYFDQGTLKDKLKEGEISVKEIGGIKSEVFVNLQQIPGRGYGWPVGYDGNVLTGNFSDIDSFMDGWFCEEEMLEMAKKHEPTVAWDEELKRRSDVVRKENPDNVSHLGSFDFQTGHFFATEPPTFFDGNPRLEPKYFDLAYLLTPSVDATDDDFEINKIIVKKFETGIGLIDKGKLFNALWLQTFRKATNLLLRPNEKRTRRGLHMLKVLSDSDVLEKHLEKYF